MMARLERRAEILRMQIADQRNSPMPQRKAAVEQCERRVGIVLLARKMRESGGLNARRRHDRVSARPPCVTRPTHAMRRNRHDPNRARRPRAPSLRDYWAFTTAPPPHQPRPLQLT